MPRQYEHIRDSLIARGYSEKEAKRIAAMTWNSRHPNDPVGRSGYGYDALGKRKPIKRQGVPDKPLIPGDDSQRKD